MTGLTPGTDSSDQYQVIMIVLFIIVCLFVFCINIFLFNIDILKNRILHYGIVLHCSNSLIAKAISSGGDKLFEQQITKEHEITKYDNNIDNVCLAFSNFVINLNTCLKGK